MKAWTHAGFGLIAVTGGAGHEHTVGRILHTHYGPVRPPELGAEKKTNNVGEVAAFVQALRWARSPEIRDRPIVMRYDSKYAALITTGVYKAKANKKLIATAQAEWKATMAAKDGRLWMRHVPAHSNHPWNEEADRLAKLGCRGKSHYGPFEAD
jgi:ribonuclease HI